MKTYKTPNCKVIQVNFTSALLQGSPGGELESSPKTGYFKNNELWENQLL